MPGGKRYYWFKMSGDFFARDTTDYLLAQRRGAELVVLYLMLCAECLNTCGVLGSENGELFIPADAKKLRRKYPYFSQNFIRNAMELYQKLGLFSADARGALRLRDYEEITGSETVSALRKRRQRRDAAGDNVPPEEREKGEEGKREEEEKESLTLPTTTAEERAPTLAEVEAYCAGRGSRIDPLRFFQWYGEKGWFADGRLIDWRDRVAGWESREAVDYRRKKRPLRRALPPPERKGDDDRKKAMEKIRREREEDGDEAGLG